MGVEKPPGQPVTLILPGWSCKSSPESDCSAYFSYPPISGSDSESDLKPSSPHPYHHTKRFLAKYAAQQVVKQEPANDHLINLGHLSQRISAMREMGCHPASQHFPGDHDRFSPSPRLKAEYKQEFCFGVDPFHSHAPLSVHPRYKLPSVSR